MQTTRRKMLALLSSLGIGSLPFQRALAQKTEAAQLVTREMIADAEWIAGIQLSDQQRQMAADALTEGKNAFGSLREANLDYDLTPALIFQFPDLHPAKSPTPGQVHHPILDQAP